METRPLFILGAGFSKAITNGIMPLLNELTDDIVNVLKHSDQDDIYRYWKKYIEEPNIGNIRNATNHNFEDIMTFLSSKFAYETYIDEHLKYILYQRVTEVIVEIFQRKNLEKEISHERYLIDFAHFLKHEKADIFTFNYDLVLEYLLAKVTNDELYHNHPSTYFEKWYRIKKMPSYYNDNLEKYRTHTKNILTIYKLHGSINWLYDKSSPTGIRVSSSFIPSEYAQGLDYLLVPPTMLKNFSFQTDLLNFQWQNFREKLKQAEKIYIIGYSIPQTDVATRYILQTHLNSSSEIFIVTLKPTIDIQDSWYNLFAEQDQKKKLHIIDDGFNKNAMKKMGII